MSQHMYWILDHEGVPMPACHEEWSGYIQNPSNMMLSRDEVGEFEIRTRFRGIDNLVNEPNALPAIWETIIRRQDRMPVKGVNFFYYSSKEKALLNHARILERLRKQVAEEVS